MKDEIRIIVAGGRDFNDYELMKSHLKELIGDTTKSITIVSGMARGADTLGIRFADEFGYDVARFPADWDNLGKRAGFIRNEEMAKYAEESNGILVAFWDCQSRGTKDMIHRAEKHRLQVRIVTY